MTKSLTPQVTFELIWTSVETMIVSFGNKKEVITVIFEIQAFVPELMKIVNTTSTTI